MSDSNEFLKNRSDIITILEKYSLFLEKEGYMDIDWRTEEPFAIDTFLEKNKELPIFNFTSKFCECMDTTEVHKINDKYICSKCNKPIKN